jgi:hypothetical protein
MLKILNIQLNYLTENKYFIFFIYIFIIVIILNTIGKNLNKNK